MHIRKIIFSLLIFVSAATNLCAQKAKTTFHSLNTFSFLIGQSSTDWGFQTVNGLKYKNFFSGISIGLDHYHYNSYPVFFDQRIFFGKRKDFFAYGDVGYNFNNKTNKPGKEVGYYTQYHFRGGLYSAIGLGYVSHLTIKTSIAFSAGFSYKEIHNKTAIVQECFVAPCPVDYNNYQYDNGRAELRAGIDF